MILSIVVPAWNEEKYLRQCLDSITREAALSQHTVEIIVVNNASEDRTRDIALEFEEVLLVDEPKKGLPQARQSGFLASSGDLIANIDADCLMPSGWIDKACQQFSQNDDLVALSGPYNYYDLSILSKFSIKMYYLMAFVFHCTSQRILGTGAVLQGGNFILRRTALEKMGGFNTDITFYGEDTDVARRISKFGKVKFMLSLKMPTSGRRLQKEGIMRMAMRYVVNFFWIIIFRKPFTKEYTCVSNPD